VGDFESRFGQLDERQDWGILPGSSGMTTLVSTSKIETHVQPKCIMIDGIHSWTSDLGLREEVRGVSSDPTNLCRSTS
jgi:hypothetical protein